MIHGTTPPAAAYLRIEEVRNEVPRDRSAAKQAMAAKAMIRPEHIWLKHPAAVFGLGGPGRRYRGPCLVQ